MTSEDQPGAARPNGHDSTQNSISRSAAPSRTSMVELDDGQIVPADEVEELLRRQREHEERQRREHERQQQFDEARRQRHRPEPDPEPEEQASEDEPKSARKKQGKTLKTNIVYEQIMRLPGASDAQVRLLWIIAHSAVSWGRADFVMGNDELARRSNRSEGRVKKVLKSIREDFPGLVTERRTMHGTSRSWNARGIDLKRLAELTGPPWTAPKREGLGVENDTQEGGVENDTAQGVENDTQDGTLGVENDTQGEGLGVENDTPYTNRSPKDSNPSPKPKKPVTDRAASSRRSVGGSLSEGTGEDQEDRVQRMVSLLAGDDCRRRRIEGRDDVSLEDFARFVVERWTELLDSAFGWMTKKRPPADPLFRGAAFVLSPGIEHHLLDKYEEMVLGRARDEDFERFLGEVQIKDTQNMSPAERGAYIRGHMSHSRAKQKMNRAKRKRRSGSR